MYYSVWLLCHFRIININVKNAFVILSYNLIIQYVAYIVNIENVT